MNELEHLEKIDRFPVGRPFSHKNDAGDIKYGWIIGYALNPNGELVFKCKWAHRYSEQLIHPATVFHVANFCKSEPE